ncbi:MAG TPA: bifunctional aspartate transaminase/aspartate 4-decarboxylase [Tepidisphaeraceae bacterium]|nr:bifunctional aspartate transaminase/aspartate 4-decarboxylase [Tepidisphaeraceae bacterium]
MTTLTATPLPQTADYSKLSPFELKDKLIGMADEASKTRAAVMLNAGRGNPNWIATTPREAFGLMLTFGLEEARRTRDEPAVGLAGMPKSPGIAGRFEQFLRGVTGPGGVLLRRAVSYGVDQLGFDPDKFVWELTDAVIGDNYPVPDRMLVHCERIVQEYLAKEMCDGNPPPGKLDLFAVEGGTAAMTYIFHSLVTNKVLSRGDRIALGSPIFTPYLEIPHLKEYGFDVVMLEQSEMTDQGRHAWQYPEEEIRKLEDPSIKAFFLVNPSNPASSAVRQETLRQIADIVRTKRPDLLILTDDVYGTFVEGFRSLYAEIPQNTILVYSYSKHFGCTGWRLGIVGIHERNVIDRKIAGLPQEARAELNERYGALTLDPEGLKFIDRMVAESRAVGLNHTAGLSLPQQLQMALFSLFALLDDGETYKTRCRSICQDRLKALCHGLGLELHDDSLRTGYYATLDVEAWANKNVGPGFMAYVNAHRDPLELVFALANRHGTVLLNGSGFRGPPWSARVSLANLDDAAYAQIGKNLAAVVKGAVEKWEAMGRPGPDIRRD